MRHQHRMRMAQDGLFELRHPVATQREIPIMLRHTNKAMCSLPMALPMVGAAVVPTGKKKNGVWHLQFFHALDHFLGKVHKCVAAFG